MCLTLYIYKHIFEKRKALTYYMKLISMWKSNNKNIKCVWINLVKLTSLNFEHDKKTVQSQYNMQITNYGMYLGSIISEIRYKNIIKKKKNISIMYFSELPTSKPQNT